MTWLWNSMIPEISDTCLTLSTTQKMWEAVKQTYSKACDAAQVYEIRMRAISAKQGNMIVTEYANELKGLWQELDHYRQIEIKCTDDAATLKKITECDRTYDFLAGINQEFDQVKVQILCNGTFPALDTVISIVLAEESRQTVMLTSQVSNGSAMILRNGNGRNSQNKDDLVCSYCKKPRHTREKCWKLHGKPTNMEYGNKQRNS